MSNNVTSDYGWKTAAYPRSQMHVHDAVISAMQSRVPCSVLDLGCGNGFLAGRLAELGCDVVGVEADDKGVQIAARAHPNVRFIRADATSLTLNDVGRTFDVVICSEVIEHLFDPAAIVRAARLLVAPKGMFIVSTPYHGYLKNLILSLGDRWDSHHVPARCGGHIKFWSVRTLRQLLEAGDFRLVRWKGTGRLPFLWKSMIVCAVPVNAAIR
jgi:2-polyprenyl-3-methyl-5-hydroxy-6-metoxy-1,4-benzoquinol methylase